MSVTMHNSIPDVIHALQQYTLLSDMAHVAERIRGEIPDSVWQRVLQASIYVATPNNSTYQDAARDYSNLIITTMHDLVAQGLVDLTYHNLNELAMPLPPSQPHVGTLVTSCANINRLNQVGVETIDSTFWNDIAGQVVSDEVIATIEEALNAF